MISNKISRIIFHMVTYMILFNVFAYISPPDRDAYYEHYSDFLVARLSLTLIGGLTGLIVGIFSILKHNYDQ